jgi:hypothetical protein
MWQSKIWNGQDAAFRMFACIGIVLIFLHALPVRDGSRQSVDVEHLGERHFRLAPYPFGKSPLIIYFPARFVASLRFASNEELRDKFNKAVIERLQDLEVSAQIRCENAGRLAEVRAQLAHGSLLRCTRKLSKVGNHLRVHRIGAHSVWSYFG